MIYLVALATLVPVVLLRLVVAVDLWAWFVVPLGAPEIGKAWALGLLTLVMMPVKLKKDDEDRDLAWSRLVSDIGTSVMRSLASWGLGALAHWMMG